MDHEAQIGPHTLLFEPPRLIHFVVRGEVTAQHAVDVVREALVRGARALLPGVRGAEAPGRHERAEARAWLAERERQLLAGEGHPG